MGVPYFGLPSALPLFYLSSTFAAADEGYVKGGKRRRKERRGGAHSAFYPTDSREWRRREGRGGRGGTVSKVAVPISPFLLLPPPPLPFKAFELQPLTPPRLLSHPFPSPSLSKKSFF